MRGSAPEGRCGQGVPRVYREVQTRVVLDALVSNKTFWNATSAPACFRIIFSNFLFKLCGSFKTFEKDLRLLVCFNRNDERGKNGEITLRWTSLSIRALPPSRSEMLERIEKFKHFFIAFLTGAFAKGGVVVS